MGDQGPCGGCGKVHSTASACVPADTIEKLRGDLATARGEIHVLKASEKNSMKDVSRALSAESSLNALQFGVADLAQHFGISDDFHPHERMTSILRAVKAKYDTMKEQRDDALALNAQHEKEHDADFNQMHTEFEEAWEATENTVVRGLTTLADVIKVQREQRDEAIKGKDAAMARLRTQFNTLLQIAALVNMEAAAIVRDLHKVGL